LARISETSGGIFHSMDGGNTWRRIDHWSAEPATVVNLFDPFNPTRAYAGSFSGGIYI